MKTLLTIPIVILSLAFELIGRILAQIASMAMSIATMLLSSISKSE